MDAADKEPKLVSTGYRMGLYLAWLIGQIAKSSLHVVKLVWGNPKKLSPALATIPIKNIPKSRHVLYANSITLTPGTLSVDIEDDEITVHALEAESINELKNGDMENKIRQIWGND
jgi:multicomponent Na+:H+ antiporter subunit E